MIAVDTNILVHAHRGESPWHEPAAKCLWDLAEGTATWAIPWPCLHEFIGVVSHERIFTPPTPLSRILEQITGWLESPSLVLLAESPGYWDVLADLVKRARVTGPRIHDARIAALCMHHGVRELLTADRDFGRFGQLTTRNPLA